MHAAAGTAPCKTEPMLPRIAALLACALFLTGCSLLGTAPSPVTTYTDATGESVKAVESLLTRARQAFREAYQRIGDTP